MGKRNRRNGQRRQERRFRVIGERKDPPDMKKLGRALLSLAEAELERQAQLEHETAAGTGGQAHETRDEAQNEEREAANE
ncbi:hypothetical protein [Thermomonospora umbrina]|uniref:Uncharacterized protein n=1 Tax=Thermomonospora umbrina TaxID=111806 RepID=A0A3D9SLE7_9ACTN|nr:hypothetical protein [Thermomonospora umbrina]REE94733.1 hypothetical protein DFJ69_0083 [Thermomonospora umbrina]